MSIKEITGFFEKIAPSALQETYDNSGLLVGNPDGVVNNILISLDCTEEIIEEAVKKKCELVICHHPVIFEGLKKITGKTPTERTIIKAIQNNIAVFAIHTNLDNVEHGVNGKIAQKIGLTNCKILAPKKGLLRKLVTFCPNEQAANVRQALFEAGAGKIGNYDECSYNSEGFGTFKASPGTNPFVGEINQQHRENETRIETIFPVYKEKIILKQLIKVHPYEEVAYDIYPLENEFSKVGSGIIGDLSNPMSTSEFLSSLKNIFNIPCIRHTKIVKEHIKKVAICGGAGVFLINRAIGQGADVFLTGDIKYHQFFDADNQLVLADIGHYESEQFTKELIFDILNKNFSNFAVHFSEINTNPINYL